ncbi:MAG: hypothetical protein U0Q16_23860 [Bryobacteraceae bacterium]
MADENKEIKDYADGWITERKGTDAPPFLKASYVVVGLGCTAYLVVFMNGEVNHEDRGPLVRAFNAATQSSDGLMYAIAAIALVFVLAVIAFAFSKVGGEEH